MSYCTHYVINTGFPRYDHFSRGLHGIVVDVWNVLLWLLTTIVVVVDIVTVGVVVIVITIIIIVVVVVTTHHGTV